MAGCVRSNVFVARVLHFSAFIKMVVVRAESTDYSKNDGKNTEKDNKIKKNSYTSSPRVGLEITDGDVDGVD